MAQEKQRSIKPEKRPEPEKPKREPIDIKNHSGKEVVITIENAEINVTHSGAKGDFSGANFEIKNKDNNSPIAFPNMGNNAAAAAPAGYPPAMAPANYGAPMGGNMMPQANPAASGVENILSIDEQRSIIEELRTLKGELQNLQQNQNDGSASQGGKPEGQRRTLEDYLEEQRKKKEEKMKSYGSKFKIIGSNRQRMEAEVLDDGVFVTGSKIYKWGDMRQLDK